MIQKGEQTRERILSVSEKIILNKGYSGTSIEEIIEESKITKGGFFYHFKGGKGDLARQLIRRYLEQDRKIFRAHWEKARSLSEDPLQRVLIFLNLLAQMMADLPNGHPGCLVATFTYENQIFDVEIQKMVRKGVLEWRVFFRKIFEEAAAKYPLSAPVDLNALADQLTSVIEGGIIVSRSVKDPRVLPDQVLLFRDYVRLLFGDR